MRDCAQRDASLDGGQAFAASEACQRVMTSWRQFSLELEGASDA